MERGVLEKVPCGPLEHVRKRVGRHKDRRIPQMMNVPNDLVSGAIASIPGKEKGLWCESLHPYPFEHYLPRLALIRIAGVGGEFPERVPLAQGSLQLRSWADGTHRQTQVKRRAISPIIGIHLVGDITCSRST